MEKSEKIVEQTINEFFKLLEIEGDIAVTQSEEEIGVVINSEETGLLIGYHGDTLESLQLILSLCLARKLGDFKRVTIEVGDYRKNREEWLKNLANQTKEKVLAENKEIELYDLKSWERRVIHLILQDDREVVSESVGEGKNRVLVVKPR